MHSMQPRRPVRDRWRRTAKVVYSWLAWTEEHAGGSMIGREHAIVFVHGILSSCDRCFPGMLASVRQDADRRFEGWHLFKFDYDYHQHIADSAADLVSLWTTPSNPQSTVV